MNATLNAPAVHTSFLREIVIYASRVREFNAMDWASYIAWVGLIFGLFFAIMGFLLVGHFNGVTYPAWVWNVPVGTFIFCGAIAFDTIGHRTVYKAEISKGENLVHHITIFAGITSCLALCLAYSERDFWRIPSISLIALTVFYSMIDEALHWRRYLNLYSDRVEMWSHFFIFLGHTIMILSWYQWFDRGYPGVAETLRHIPGM